MRNLTFAAAFLLGLLLGLAVASPTTAARAANPLQVVHTYEYNSGVNRPWLDQTCYDDDHGYSFVATGYLAPGATWSHESPLPICTPKHLKYSGEWGKRSGIVPGFVDYGGHPVPVRVTVSGSTASAEACNTDLSKEHVQLDDDAPGSDEPRGFATWSVTNTGSRAASVTLSGHIRELPWEGGEGEWSLCLLP